MDLKELEQALRRARKHPIRTSALVLVAIVMIGSLVIYTKVMETVATWFTSSRKQLAQHEAAVIVFTTLESRLSYSPNERALRDTDFLTWLEDEFNRTQREAKSSYRVELVRDTANSLSAERIRTAGSSKYFEHVDVLLGGNPELHEELTGRLVIDVDTDKLSIPASAVGPERRWLGFYVGCLGIVWNCAIVDPEWKPRRFDDLATVSSSKPNATKLQYVVPVPKDSSAAYQLLLNLGLTGAGPSTDLDLDRAAETYRNLLKGGYVNPQGASTVDLVSEGRVAAGVEWLHDAVWKADVRGLNYPEVRAYIPEDALLSIGCVSLLDRPAGNPLGALEFVKFLLSDEVQVKHYELQRRLPIRPDLIQQITGRDGTPFGSAIKEMCARHETLNRLPLLTSWGFYRHYSSPGTWRQAYLPRIDSLMSELAKIQLSKLPAADPSLRKVRSNCNASQGWPLAPLQ